MNILCGNEEGLLFFCDNLDFQVDGKKVPRDAAHPHLPFTINTILISPFFVLTAHKYLQTDYFQCGFFPFFFCSLCFDISFCTLVSCGFVKIV